MTCSAKALTVGLCSPHDILLEGVVAVWIWEATFTPLLGCDVPMKIDHAGNVLPASANNLSTCVILLDSDHKPVIEGLQLLAAFDWHSIQVVCLPTVLLQVHRG